MRTLYLLRHAKSARDDPTLVDHDRPLAARGVRDTGAVAEHMRQRGIAPDVVLCSSSRRTRETLDLLGDAISTASQVHVEDGLYAASADVLLHRLRALPDASERVLVIGHNPGLQRLAVNLSISGEQLSQMKEKFPTAALATLDAPIDTWSDLDAAGARLIGFVRPRDLDNA